MNKKRQITFSLVRNLSAIGIALLVAFVLIILGTDLPTIGERLATAGEAMKYMLISPLVRGNGTFSTKSFTDILASMIPIIFTGLATCVMFSANQFNLGAEGGIMLGAFVTAMVAIYAPLPAVVLPIVAILAGACATALLLLIPGLLKARLGVSEMVNSLMLNYVVQYVILYLMNTYLADKNKGQIQSYEFQSQAALPQLVNNGSKLSWGFVIALVMTVLIWFFMYRTKWGYSIRMIGINQDFSKYSGLNVVGVIVLSQVVGGFLAGMGGGIEELGRYTAYDWMALPGYGWTGITVAILAGNNPAYVPLAAFFMSYLSKGCQLMSTYCAVPAQLIDILQAVIFLFFAAEHFLSGYRQKLVVKSAQEEIAAQQKKEAAEKGAQA
jgi:ABC-type uncharacterized transport system permease subunit